MYNGLPAHLYLFLLQYYVDFRGKLDIKHLAGYSSTEYMHVSVYVVYTYFFL